MDLSDTDGTYVLSGVQQTRDQRLEAEARVTVAGRPTGGFTLHFVEVPTIPIVLSVDAAPRSAVTATGQTVAAAAPTAQSLNLRLQKMGDPEEANSVVPMTLPDKSFVFRAGFGQLPADRLQRRPMVRGVRPVRQRGPAATTA